MALALMKNYDPFKAPTHFKLTDLMKKFDKTFGATGKNYGKVTRGPHAGRHRDAPRRIAGTSCSSPGMWFQDLFNYDFRRTERCIIPYATQEGEISFCAYNTGIGWRNIIEKMHMTATLTKWYEEHGRHEIFAGGKKVRAADRPSTRLVLDAEAVAAGKQTRPRRRRHRQDRARREAARAGGREEEDRSRERADGRALPPARAEGAAAGPVIQIQGLGAKKKQAVQEVLHKPTL